MSDQNIPRLVEAGELPNVRKPSPIPPRELTDRGLALWYDMVGTWEFGPHELFLLAELCHAATVLDSLRERQKSEDLISEGAMGQVIAAPLLGEMRQWAAVAAKLISSLKLPIEGAKSGNIATEQSTSDKMRAMVMKRHHPERTAAGGRG